MHTTPEFAKRSAFEELSGPGEQLAELIDACPIEDIAQASILDLGFKDHGSILSLHHLFGLRRYVGVDTMSRDEFKLYINPRGAEPPTEELSRPETGNDEYQEYLLFHKCILKHDEPLSKPGYHQVFELLLETSALDFLRENTERFDMVILSDVLHLIKDRSEADEVLDRSFSATKAGGLLYVQVYLEGAPELPAERYPFSQGEYERIKTRMKSVLHEGEISKCHVRLVGLT